MSDKNFTQDTSKILEVMTRFDERQKNDSVKINDIHSQLKAQWKKIDSLSDRMTVVENDSRWRDKVWAAIVSVIVFILGQIGISFHNK